MPFLGISFLLIIKLYEENMESAKNFEWSFHECITDVRARLLLYILYICTNPKKKKKKIASGRHSDSLRIRLTSRNYEQPIHRSFMHNHLSDDHKAVWLRKYFFIVSFYRLRLNQSYSRACQFPLTRSAKYLIEIDVMRKGAKYELWFLTR